MLSLGKPKFPIKSISRNTALACLRELRGSRGVAGVDDADDDSENELSIKQIVALARPEFRVNPVVLDWDELTRAADGRNILVILKNGNAICVIGTGRPGHEEIVAYDPLYESGDTFYLPRTELEDAWQGEALLLSPQTPRGWWLLHKFILIVSVAGLLMGAYMLLNAFYTLVPARTGNTVRTGQDIGIQNPARLETDYWVVPRIPVTEVQHVQEQVTPPATVDENGARAAQNFVLGHPDTPVTVPETPHVDMNAKDEPSSELPKTSPPSLTFDVHQGVGTSPPGAQSEPAHADDSASRVQSEPVHAADSASTTATNSQPEEQPKTAAVRAPTEKELDAVISRIASASTTTSNSQSEEQPKTAAARALTEKELNAVISRTASNPDDAVSTTTSNSQPEEQPKTTAARALTEKELNAVISRAASHPDDAASTTTTNLQSQERSKTAAIRVLTEKELNAVISRADSMISRGDVHSGRLLYEYAAEAGSGPAALRLGETFDPAFLGLSGLRGVRGDPLKAAQWYERARQLGVAEAEILLRSIIGEEGRNR